MSAMLDKLSSGARFLSSDYNHPSLELHDNSNGGIDIESPKIKRQELLSKQEVEDNRIDVFRPRVMKLLEE